MMLEWRPGLRVFPIAAVVGELYLNSRGGKLRLVDVTTRVGSREVVRSDRFPAQLDEAFVLTCRSAVVGRPRDGRRDTKQPARSRDEPEVHVAEPLVAISWLVQRCERLFVLAKKRSTRVAG